MYFIKQIREQFLLTLTLRVGWPDAAINEVREQQAAKEETEWPLNATEVLDHARDTNARLDSDVARESEVAASLWVEWTDWTDAVEWDPRSDTLSSWAELPSEWWELISEWSESPEKTNAEVLESLTGRAPFDSVPEDEMAEILASIDIEWLEVPEWMTREEALEATLNEAIEKEATEYDERINKILEDEGIELTEEQRAALGEYLDWIDNPNIWNIQEFLQENNLWDMSVPGESEVPSFLTNLYTSGDSYRGLPSRGGSWSGENPYTGEAFSGDAWLNDEFYNVERLRSELPSNIRQQADQLAEDMTQKISSQWWNPENWIGALYRNASNNPDFNANQPVLLHNLSTATACVYINWSAHVVPATHGKWVGNANGMHGTPIGSFQMYGMTNGKYQGRVWVNGLEQMRQNISNDSTQNMHEQDPASMWNANSNDRLIRVHESRWSRTQGCSWLPTQVAVDLAEAMRASRIGIMERFVSDPAWTGSWRWQAGSAMS